MKNFATVVLTALIIVVAIKQVKVLILRIKKDLHQHTKNPIRTSSSQMLHDTNENDNNNRCVERKSFSDYVRGK